MDIEYFCICKISWHKLFQLGKMRMNSTWASWNILTFVWKGLLYVQSLFPHPNRTAFLAPNNKKVLFKRCIHNENWLAFLMRWIKHKIRYIICIFGVCGHEIIIALDTCSDWIASENYNSRELNWILMWRVRKYFYSFLYICYCFFSM